MWSIRVSCSNQPCVSHPTHVWLTDKGAKNAVVELMIKAILPNFRAVVYTCTDTVDELSYHLLLMLFNAVIDRVSHKLTERKLGEKMA